MILSLAFAATAFLAPADPPPEPSLADIQLTAPLTDTHKLLLGIPEPAPAPVAVAAPVSEIVIERASFTAEKTPPPPPPPEPEPEPELATVETPTETYILAGRTQAEAVELVQAPTVSQSKGTAPTAARPTAVIAGESTQTPKIHLAEAATVSTDASTTSTTGGSIVATAKKYLGTPYVWGGTNPAVGLDCSGLVQLVFKQNGISLPRVARAQATRGTAIASLAQAQPGDVLGMRNGSHIAIYVGGNKILHSPRPGETVSIRSLNSADDIDTIRRF